METLRVLWRKKVLVLFLVAIAILLPSASVKPAQMLSKALLTSIGIDRTEDGQYEVSGAMIVNKFTNGAESSAEIISARSANMTQAINKLSANQGRKVSLAHCNLIILGAGLGGENISGPIGTFLRKYEMSNNALLVWTTDDPKKIQETSAKKITGSLAGLLETVAAYNQEEVLGKQTTVEEFYKNYLRPSSTAYMGCSGLEEENIVNKKTLALFKNGKHALTLNNNETLSLSLLQGRKTTTGIVLNNVKGDLLENATVDLQLLDKSNCIKTEFRNNRPHVTITSRPKVKVSDIIEKDRPERYIDLEDSPPLNDIKTALDSFVRINLSSALSRVNGQRIDLLQIYDKFYREHNKETKNYIRTKTVDDFLGDIVFEAEVNSTVVV